MPAYSQNEPVRIIGKVQDSIAPKVHSPSRAALYSAILPGMGQLYNKKNAFWKLPIVYGGAVALGMSIAWNNNLHLEYRDEYYAIKFSLPRRYPNLTEDQAFRGQKLYARNRDFLVLISIGAYGLQVLDAFVEAHLKTFNVDDNLALRFEPYQENLNGQVLSGMSLKLDLGHRGRRGLPTKRSLLGR